MNQAACTGAIHDWTGSDQAAFVLVAVLIFPAPLAATQVKNAATQV